MLYRQESQKAGTDSILFKRFIFVILNYEYVCVRVRAGALGSQEASDPPRTGVAGNTEAFNMNERMQVQVYWKNECSVLLRLCFCCYCLSI